MIKATSIPALDAAEIQVVAWHTQRDGSGKPSGLWGVDDTGKSHRHYLRLSYITAWQKLNKYYTKRGR
jgi:hypothetical protein